jgi:hypothetical protein
MRCRVTEPSSSREIAPRPERPTMMSGTRVDSLSSVRVGEATSTVPRTGTAGSSRPASATASSTSGCAISRRPARSVLVVVQSP